MSIPVWMKIGRKSIINGSVSHNFPTLIGSALNDDYTQNSAENHLKMGRK
jgi:hypothetical protein